MSGIDPTRLSRLLATLGKPAAQGSGSNQVKATGAPAATPLAKSTARDPEQLRARLRKRLADLWQGSEDFHALAPTITIQEILRWEFGENVVNHGEFGRVVDKVVAALLDNEETGAALHRVIETLLGSERG